MLNKVMKTTRNYIFYCSQRYRNKQNKVGVKCKQYQDCD